MFASKTPRDLNHDPEPWAIHTVDGLRRGASYQDGGIEEPTTLDPRPEFDHVQHNGPNPILAGAFRQDVADVFVPEEFDVAKIARSWLDGDALDLYIDMYDDAVIDHTRKVLSRLAALSERSTA